MLTLALVASGASAESTAAKKAKVKLSVPAKGQKAILKKGIVVKGKTKAKHTVRVKLSATSSSFDDPKAKKIVKPAKLKLKPKKHHKGGNGKGRKASTAKGSVRLKLTPNGKKAVSSCLSRQIVIKAGKSKIKFSLKRDSAKCKPGNVDTSQAACDFIGDQSDSLCMVPFPDDFYTRDSASSATGKLIDFKQDAMPKNEAGVAMDPAPYNLNDGFSPGQAIVVRIPGIETAADLAANDVPRLAQLGTYANPDSKIMVLDAATGERHPIWAEIDSNSKTDDDGPAKTAVLIHPSVNFEAKHRYIVVIRDLVDAAGNEIQAPPGFRYYRDKLPTKDAAIKSQNGRFEGIFRTLRDAGIKRADLNLAWDFTVASDENIAGRALFMRDDALEQLGDTSPGNGIPEGNAPDFTVVTVTNFANGTAPGEDTRMARRVQGTFEVPCYLAPNCEPGGTMDLNDQGLPVQHGTYTAKFDCMIPRVAIDGVPLPARPSVYGHGLLGRASEATSTPQKTLGNNFNIVSCATDELGLSFDDIPTALGVLAELGKFPQAADRLQQGLLNEILLGRLMIRPDGFLSDAAFRVNDAGPVDGTNPGVIDPSQLYYNGNSQGGIMGGAFMALSPDATRGSLGVPGMNYSVLLNRSVDFDEYAEAALFPNYKDKLKRPLVLSMIQMLWDRGEANGYAHRMTDNPLPNTPPHEVLLNVAFGDHQVTNWAADTEARTIGASAHAPVVDAGRWPGVDPLWNIPRIESFPFTDSAIVYWDSGPVRDDPGSLDPAELLGTDPPPLENVPNRSGEDPHGLPRSTLEEQQMVSDFLMPNASSHIDDECTGPAGPACHDRTFGGTPAP